MENNEKFVCEYVNLKNFNTGEIISVFGEVQENCFVTRPDFKMHSWDVWSLEKHYPLANLKRSMVQGLATAETFESYIKEYGLCSETICLIEIFYKGDYQEELDKLAIEFAEAEASFKLSNIEVL